MRTVSIGTVLRSRAVTALPVVLLLHGCNGGGQSDIAARTEPIALAPGVLLVEYAADSADTFPSWVDDSIPALQWLRMATDSAGIPLEVREYPFGTLVERIGPRRNGDGGYWLYKVNGAMVPRSADAHRIASTDTVLFFFDER
jgi:hypothetical protein